MRKWIKKTINGNPLISMVVAAYTTDEERRLYSLLSLLNCFRAQTYQNWEVIIVHDGPIKREHKIQIDSLNDSRIKLICSEIRIQKYGHPNRILGINEAKGDFIGLSNDDNFYVPVYFEWMIYSCQTNNANLAYCNMVHSHQHWRIFITEPKINYIDCGCWIGSKEIVKNTPWRDFGFTGDGVFFEDIYKKNNKIANKINAVLFIHN